MLDQKMILKIKNKLIQIKEKVESTLAIISELPYFFFLVQFTKKYW